MMISSFHPYYSISSVLWINYFFVYWCGFFFLLPFILSVLIATLMAYLIYSFVCFQILYLYFSACLGNEAKFYLNFWSHWCPECTYIYLFNPFFVIFYSLIFYPRLFDFCCLTVYFCIDFSTDVLVKYEWWLIFSIFWLWNAALIKCWWF